jgi:mono/diheme cytochrome c family protein
VLLSLDAAGLPAIEADLVSLLDDTVPEKRALAIAGLVRVGRPLKELAERDRDALLAAVSAMSADQLPASAVADLMAMVDEGTVETATGVLEVARLSTDRDTLFAWLAAKVDPARGLGFDQWGDAHRRAMAALQGMHSVDRADWPAGYSDYYLAPPAEEVYLRGQELYNVENGGCIKCHGPDGRGAEGFPPLADSPWVMGDPRRSAAIVEHGLTGEIVMHDGRRFNSTMDPLRQGANLSGADVAAILTYIRRSWGNFGPVVTYEDIKTLPSPPEGGVWKADEVLMHFPLAYDRLLPGGDAPRRPGVAGWHAPRGGLAVMLGVVLLLNVLFVGMTYLANRR